MSYVSRVARDFNKFLDIADVRIFFSFVGYSVECLTESFYKMLVNNCVNSIRRIVDSICVGYLFKSEFLCLVK